MKSNPLRIGRRASWFVAFAAVVGACTSPGSAPGDEGLSASTLPIIGGAAATTYPEAALVNLYRNGQLVAACSGSVIAPRVVLTAGHCVDGFTGWHVTAPYASGQTATSSNGTTYDWHENGAETVNPNHHDIGLVFLDSAINLATYPTLATSELPQNSKIVNLGRINNGVLSSTDLYVSPPINVVDGAGFGYPLDYEATDEIQPGDSGGPDEVSGATSHVIAAVNSGAGSGEEVLARVDLLSAWIAQQIASHGGGGSSGGTADGGTPGGPAPGSGSGGASTCRGQQETEPNNSYTQPNALGSGATCGNIDPGSDQDWFTFSVAAAGATYDVKVSATGDAQVAMWKLVNGAYSQVANTSPTEIAHASSGPGAYVLAVYSPSGQIQTYAVSPDGSAVSPPAPPSPSDAGPPATDGGAQSGFDAFQTENLTVINQFRAKGGVAPLALDARLNTFALAGSTELSRDHSPHQHFINAANAGTLPSSGFSTGAAENQSDPNGWAVLSQDPTENELMQIDGIVQAMIDEGPGGGHYQNIMNPAYARLGAGLLEVNGHLYLTNDFSGR